MRLVSRSIVLQKKNLTQVSVMVKKSNKEPQAKINNLGVASLCILLNDWTRLRLLRIKQLRILKRVIWNYEYRVEKSRNPRQLLVFREPEKQWLANGVYLKEKDKKISLMIQGWFGDNRKGPLISITQNMNKIRDVILFRRYLSSIIYQQIFFSITT